MAQSVAIVEPDTHVAQQVEAGFSQIGFACHVMTEGDIVDFVRQRNPTVILLSVELPRGSGYSLCNRLKKQPDLKRIPVILTSSQETPEAFEQHRRSATPADAYVHKPLSMDQLLDSIVRLLPEAFPDGAPLASQFAPAAAVPGPSATAAGPSTVTPATGTAGSGGTAMGSPMTVTPATGERAAPTSPPPRPTRSRPEAPKASGPTFDELIATGRTDDPIAAPAATAGPEAKLSFLRESLRRREQDIGKARELWLQREREMGQLAELLDLRERELERARKAREDLLAQLTAAEDRIGSLRLDVELGSERGERLEREKKALAAELEDVVQNSERDIAQLTARVAALEDALRSEQALRSEEGERSGSEIRELVADLENARADFARRDGAARDREAALNKMISELQARVAELDVQLETTSGKLADAEKDGEALRRELASIREKKSQDDAHFRAQIEDLDGRIRELTLDKESLEEELSKTSTELTQTRNQLDDRSARIVDLEAELADFQGQLSDTRGELEHANTRAAELSAELADTQQEALSLGQQKHKAETRLAETTGNLQATAKRLEETQAELEDTRKKAAAQAREFESRIHELKAALADRDARLNEQGAALTTTQATLRDTEARLGDKAREWDQERVGRQKDVLKRDQRISDLEQRTRELDSALHDNERQAKTREAALVHDLDAANARVNELDRDLNRVKARGNELEALVQDGKERFAELTKELRRTESQLGTTREALKEVQQKLEETAHGLAEAQNQNAFLQSELNEEKTTHTQDVQTQTANLERLEKNHRDRIEKLQAEVTRLKSELAAAQGETEERSAKLKQTDDARMALVAQLDREQRERQTLADRIGVLDDEIEDAQAQNEKLQDELTRVRTQAKRATDDLAVIRREKASLESDFAEREGSLFKKVEENKASVAEEQKKGRAELEAARKERDEVKARYTELRAKAEAALKRTKDAETAATQRAESLERSVHDLQGELRVEREARVREKAQAEAAQEKLQKQLSDASQKASSEVDGELQLLRTQVKERDEKVARLTLETSQMREKAREAIARAKEAQARAAANGGGDEAMKKSLEEARAKYGNAVNLLKEQAEKQKQFEEKFKELAEKHRRALAAIEELKRRPSLPPGSGLDDGDSLPPGDSTVVLPNPLLKGRP